MTTRNEAADALLTPKAVRDAAQQMLTRAEAGALENFTVDRGKLRATAERVVEVTRRAYPDVTKIPYHGRYRHFAAGGVDRLATLRPALAAMSREEALAARFDLVITSVLLDAGAGAAWSYRESGAKEPITRSEGLAVASFDAFRAGLFAGKSAQPLAATGEGLAGLTVDALAAALQVSDANPLVGLEGRAELLRRLGVAVQRDAAHFDHHGTRRLGHLAYAALHRTRAGVIEADVLLRLILDALGGIWLGRALVGGVPLGDTWKHSKYGLIPFHKLSQWLTYSLLEPLEEAGVRVVALDRLTGLPEYRNGGLFIDMGVIVPKHDAVLGEEHDVASDVVIEWRALTVALLDAVAEEVRELLEMDAFELPLARVLEGGTWATGRLVASEKRSGGGSPIRVRSDGTVF